MGSALLLSGLESSGGDALLWCHLEQFAATVACWVFFTLLLVNVGSHHRLKFYFNFLKIIFCKPVRIKNCLAALWVPDLKEVLGLVEFCPQFPWD